MQPQPVPMPMVAGWSLDVTIEKLMNTPHLNSKGEYINPQFLPSSSSSASTNQIHVNVRVSLSCKCFFIDLSFYTSRSLSESETPCLNRPLSCTGRLSRSCRY